MQPEFIPFVENLITVSYEKIMNHEFTHGCGKEDCNWCNFVRENFDLHEGPTKVMAV
jgi:DNA helicase-2/ATP-dependent DNA helicase PcrA